VLAVLAVVAALVAITPPRRRPRRAVAQHRARGSDAEGRDRPRSGLVAIAVPGLAGTATALLLGGNGGLAAGAVAAGATFVALRRLEPVAQRERREALERQAPLVVDLVAACLASGAPLERSLEVASSAVGPPAAHVLSRATTALRLGGDPAEVWSEVARHDALAPMARAVARSQQTGAPLASLLPRVADQARAAHRTRAEARIRTAAVRLTAPLGVAFLPAFVLLGVVPVVASWVGRLL
jgi:Flp pilus assembly protein TadB